MTNRSRPFLCWIVALVALVAAAGSGLTGGRGCCCDDSCPLGAAMAKIGIECGMGDADGCSLQPMPRAPAPGSHASDALEPGVLWAGAAVPPPGAAERLAGPVSSAGTSFPGQPEIPPPRSS